MKALTVIIVFYIVFIKQQEIRMHEDSHDEESTLANILTSSKTTSSKSTSFIKRKIEDFIIKAVKLSGSINRQAANRTSNITRFCADPDVDILEKLKIEMMDSLFDGYGILDYPPVTKVLEKLIVVAPTSDTEIEKLKYGTKMCNESSLRILYDHEKGLCPWHYTVDYRTDRYPRLRMQAICNCVKCHYLNQNRTRDTHYECRAIKKLTPVLVRDGACSNGVNNWSVRFEHVSIACMCASDATLHAKDINIE